LFVKVISRGFKRTPGVKKKKAQEGKSQG